MHTSIFRDENEDTGFVIDTDEVGLRLKAFEYWKCSETGLTSDTAVPNTIKFVLAESLPGQGNIMEYKSKQYFIETFYKENIPKPYKIATF